MQNQSKERRKREANELQHTKRQERSVQLDGAKAIQTHQHHKSKLQRNLIET